MKLEVTFLGTGSSVPTAKRNHTGILVETEKETILVDCGEGIQRQFRVAKINPCKLTKILLTHWHADHALGLAGLLYTLGTSNYSKTLEIYGPKGTIKKIELLQKVYNHFKINLKIKEISKKVFESSNLIIEAAKMKHGITTNAYSIIIKDKIRLDKTKLKKLKLPNSPILKKLQEGKDITHPETKKKIKSKSVTYLQKGKKITIILDTGLNNNAINLAKFSDALICEATFSEEEEEKAIEYNHLTTKQAATIAKKAKCSSLILTHLSQKHERNSQKLLKEAKKSFTNTSLAIELKKIKI